MKIKKSVSFFDVLKARFRSLVDLLFGFDFFISYSHSDGYQYPEQLTERLESLGFKVFLDSRIYVVGDDLKNATRRRIRMSKKLIVVAREKALESHWVLKEVEECLLAGRIPIVIDINRTIEDADPQSEIKKRLMDKLHIRESLQNIDSAPSEETVTALVKSFDSTRQDTIRQRVVAFAAVVFAILGIFSTWLFFEADQSRKEAELQRDIAVSRELAAKAQLLNIRNPDQIFASLNLASSSLEIINKTGYPNPESNQIFRYLLDKVQKPSFVYDTKSELGKARFSPRKNFLAVSGARGKLAVVDSKDWKKVLLIQHTTDVTDFRFASDGETLVSLDSSEIIVTQVASGAEILRTANTIGVVDAYFSADGSEILFMAPAKEAETQTSKQQLWSLFRHKMNSHEFSPSVIVERARSVDVSESGKFAAWHTFYPENATTVLDIGGNRPPYINQIEDDDYEYFDLAISPNGKWLARTYRYDGEMSYVEVFDIQNSKPKRRVFPLVNYRPVTLISFGNDGTLAVKVDSKVRVLDLKSGEKPILKADIQVGDSDRVQLSGDGRFLSALTGESVHIWDVGHPGKSQWMPHDQAVDQMVFGPYSDMVTISGSKMYVWKPWYSAKAAASSGREPRGTVSPDGRYEIVRRGGNLAVYETGAHRLITKHDLIEGRADLKFLFSDDGKVLVAGNREEPVRKWKLPDGAFSEPVGDLRGEPLAISKDGQYLATRFKPKQGAREAIAVWNIEKGQLLAQWPNGFSYGFYQLSDGGRYLLKRELLLDTTKSWLWNIDNDEIIDHENIHITNLGDNVLGFLDKTNELFSIYALLPGKNVGKTGNPVDRIYLDRGAGRLAAVRGKQIDVWSLKDRTLEATVHLQELPKSVAFSHDGEKLAFISENILELWQIKGSRVLHDRIVFSAPIGDPEIGLIGFLQFSVDDKFIMWMDDVGEVERLWLWRPRHLLEEACSYVPQLSCNQETRVNEYPIFLEEKPEFVTLEQGQY